MLTPQIGANAPPSESTRASPRDDQQSSRGCFACWALPDAGTWIKPSKNSNLMRDGAEGTPLKLVQTLQLDEGSPAFAKSSPAEQAVDAQHLSLQMHGNRTVLGEEAAQESAESQTEAHKPSDSERQDKERGVLQEDGLVAPRTPAQSQDGHSLEGCAAGGNNLLPVQPRAEAGGVQQQAAGVESKQPESAATQGPAQAAASNLCLGVRLAHFCASTDARRKMHVVSSLARTGAAHRAGLQIGDVLVSINGKRVDDQAHGFVKTCCEESQASACELVLEVLRGGCRVLLTVGWESAERDERRFEERHGAGNSSSGSNLYMGLGHPTTSFDFAKAMSSLRAPTTQPCKPVHAQDSSPHFDFGRQNWSEAEESEYNTLDMWQLPLVNQEGGGSRPDRGGGHSYLPAMPSTLASPQHVLLPQTHAPVAQNAADTQRGGMPTTLFASGSSRPQANAALPADFSSKISAQPDAAGAQRLQAVALDARLASGSALWVLHRGDRSLKDGGIEDTLVPRQARQEPSDPPSRPLPVQVRSRVLSDSATCSPSGRMV